VSFSSLARTKRDGRETESRSWRNIPKALIDPDGVGHLSMSGSNGFSPRQWVVNA